MQHRFMRKDARRLALAWALVGLAACSSQPVPLAVQAGASFALAVGGDASGGIGYGGAWLSAIGRFDDQRGELAFVLIAPGGAEHPLVTQLVTRFAPDPASDGGIANEVGDGLFSGVGIHEAVAIVDVPASTPPGVYRMEIRRRRRVGTSQWESLPGVDYAQSLTVLPALVGGVRGAPTPPNGYAGALGAPLGPRLAALHPHPKVLLALPASPRPSAAHLVVSYPSARIRVRAVFEEQHGGRSSIVAWSDDPSAGRLTIDLADPLASVSALAVAFELRDPLGRGRAEPSDFAVVQGVLYDPQGAIRPGTVSIGPIR